MIGNYLKSVTPHHDVRFGSPQTSPSRPADSRLPSERESVDRKASQADRGFEPGARELLPAPRSKRWGAWNPRTRGGAWGELPPTFGCGAWGENVRRNEEKAKCNIPWLTSTEFETWGDGLGWDCLQICWFWNVWRTWSPP